MAKVVVDAGHGGTDPGASYMGRQEKNDTLALALEVGRILKENGVDVVYTRTEDVYQTPFQKAQIANESGADLFISLHRNSSPQSNQYSGVESLVYEETGIKKELAENINRELEQAGFQNLGIRERPGLVVLRRTKMPAVLVEVGFINTEADNRTLDEHFYEVAQAIADGILMTLGENGMLSNSNTEGGMTAFNQNVETERPSRYRVQTGAFQRPENAERLRQRLFREGFPVQSENAGELTLVWVGEFESLDNAAKMEQILRNYGYSTYITTVS